MNMTTRRIEVSGISWSVTDVGDGPAILLVHGFPLDHSMWSQQLQELPRQFRVIAPDLRGFGQSESAPGTITMAQFADDLAQLLTALEIEQPVTYWGLSMGGYIGWEFLQRHRQRLSRMIMADTRAAADTPEVARGRNLMADRIEKEGITPLVESMLPRLFASETHAHNPAVVEATRQVMLATNPHGAAAALRGMALRKDMSSFLPKIDLPILFLCGEHDEITPASEMADVAQRVAGAQFQIVPNVGHMAPLENGAVTNAHVVTFLTSVA